MNTLGLILLALAFACACLAAYLTQPRETKLFPAAFALYLLAQLLAGWKV